MTHRFVARGISELIRTWPKDEGRTSIQTFAADIGVPHLNAMMMAQRGSIAVTYWPELVRAAERRGLDYVTLEWLVAWRKGPLVRRSSDAEQSAA